MDNQEEKISRSLNLTMSPNSTNKRIDSEHYVEGYATTFEEPYELMKLSDGTPIYEKVARSAFAEADLSDVILRYDHKGPVYARTTNGTLGLEVTDKGLLVYADLGKTTRSKELYEDIAVENVNKMSIQCTAIRRFDEATNTFTIEKVLKMYDVSAVGIPANDDTSLLARSIEQSKKEAEQDAKKKRLALLLRLETEE
ncbi:MAG TPA: HK97 family phage prohead protease [Erysipelotrichaceae bacterium]|nr:HK97 family phage prohead protease [Erysipelotrichaceae bacterium]